MPASPEQRVEVIIPELTHLIPDDQIATVPLNYSTPWELLVAVILSAQCTDVMVNKVTEKLFQKYTNIESYASADLKEFEKDIYSTGFYRNKAKNIIAAAQVITSQYKGEIPQTMVELIQIPGVGRKTANVVLGHLHNIVDGIVVDTHIKRLALQWQLTAAQSPDAIEKDLMLLLPADRWWDVPFRMKLYGQSFSPASNKTHTDPVSQSLIQKKLLDVTNLFPSKQN